MLIPSGEAHWAYNDGEEDCEIVWFLPFVLNPVVPLRRLTASCSETICSLGYSGKSYLITAAKIM